jgi:phosphatidylserine synthase
MENVSTQKNTGFYLTLVILVNLLICALFTVFALEPQMDNAGQVLNWIFIAILVVKTIEVAMIAPIPLPKPNPRKIGYITFSIIVLLLGIAAYLATRTEGMQNIMVFLIAGALFFQSMAALLSSIFEYPNSHKDDESDKESGGSGRTPKPAGKKSQIFGIAGASIPLPKPNPKK